MQGKQVHDVRLIAVMLTHEISDILTYNVKHFAGFAEVRAVHPEEVQCA